MVPAGKQDKGLIAADDVNYASYYVVSSITERLSQQNKTSEVMIRLTTK